MGWGLKIIKSHGTGTPIRVDDADYEELSKYRWTIQAQRGLQYAIRWEPTGSRNVKGAKTYYPVSMHSQVMGVKNVDHVNGEGLDNQRSNLRPANHSANEGNSRATISYGGKPCLSKYKGVSRRGTGSWYGYINKDGIRYPLGNFATELEAALAYDAKAKKLFGEFARLNRDIYSEDF